MKVQEFINNRDKYRVDYNYQRPKDAWSMEDKQCFIDTLLRDEPIPLFFFNRNTQEGIDYIIDGQQRLFCILDFYDNKIKLNKKFSGDLLHGKKFNEIDNALPTEEKQKFLNYNLQFKILEDYDDERVRMIFSRLQRGKPLNIGERINALPGKIIFLIRKLSQHNFFKKSVPIADNRYAFYPDIARILMYETIGCKDSGTDGLFKFIDKYKDLDENSKEYKKALKVLNYLFEVFPESSFINNHAWILTIYTFISEIMITKAIGHYKNEMNKFLNDFHNNVYSDDMRISDRDYQTFYDNIRGGFSENIILTRKEILKNKFFKCSYLNIPELDTKRQITDDEKMSVFAKFNNECYICHKSFKNFRDVEYHHLDRYIDGGVAKTGNIIPLCTKCHDEIHTSAYNKDTIKDLNKKIIEDENIED